MRCRLASGLANKTFLSPILLAACFSNAAHAIAPTAEDLTKLSLDELGRVKITAASLFAHSELDTPSSISVVTEDEWQREGARYTADAFNHFASMYTVPAVFAVRGVSIRGLPLEGRAGVLSMLDGVPLNALTGSHTFEFGLGTLQSMELLRGPGSAIHGSDAFHGMMVMHSFQAQEDTASARAFLSSNGFYQSTARISREWSNLGRASIAVDVGWQPDQSNPYSFTEAFTGAQLNGERANQFDAQTLSLNLVSNSDRAWAYNSGIYLHRYSAQDFPGFGTVASGERDVSDFDAKFSLARLGVDGELSETATLTVGGYFWKVAIDNSRFQKTAGVFTEAMASVDQHRAGIRVLYKDQLGAHTQFGIGINYAQQAIDEATSTLRADSGAILRDVEQLFVGSKRATRSVTFEGNTALMANRMSVTYGGRYDSYSDVDSHFSPRLGFVLRPQNDTAVKLLYGHAFRAASVIETKGATGSILGAPDVDAETFDTVELVFLKQATEWRWQLSAFHSELRDAIALMPNPVGPPPLRVTNLGKTTADGAEFEWRVEQRHWYSLFNATYVQTNDDGAGAYATIPKWIVALSAGYRWPQVADVSLLHRFQSHIDDAESNPVFVPTELPAYHRTDLQIAKHLSSQLKLWATVRNLFARNNRVASAPPAQLGVPDESISAGLGIRYDW